MDDGGGAVVEWGGGALVVLGNAPSPVSEGDYLT